ncbi:hypothetical protein BCR43DRAFT_186701 [Syncephalastrum racemosum]|uniref:Uncharacterized protein n=1 Tax=Syncephalastrum racemosum TaxID=13706 RepID=A0A1X2HQG7_SYNRA|nr:hypothetical protein BCR43DRAFT_186701 [Syncephalastrum racemosum]
MARPTPPPKNSNPIPPPRASTPDTRNSTTSTIYTDADDTASQSTVRAIDPKYIAQQHQQQHQQQNHHQVHKSPSSRSISTLKSETILRDAITPALLKLQGSARNHKGQAALETLRRSFQIAERECPGTSQILFEEVYRCLRNNGV